MKKKFTLILTAFVILMIVLFQFHKDSSHIWSIADITEVLESRQGFHLDTIFILTKKEPEDKFFQSRISKFSGNELDKFSEFLEEISDSVIIKTKDLKTFNLERPNWLEHNNGLITVLITHYPFYRAVETTVLAGDGTFFTESRYYWFLRWRKIGSNVGVS